MKYVDEKINFGYELNFNPKNVKKVYKEASYNYKNIIKFFDSFNILINRLKRTLGLLRNLFIRNSSLFIYQYNTINTDISETTLEKQLLNINKILATIQDKKITKDLINKFFTEVDNISEIINPFRRGISFIRLKSNIKIGDFQKGYKDFKNYLRYIKIIKNLETLLRDLPYNNRITYNSITPKSSLNKYKSDFLKEDTVYIKNFDDLSPEPSSAIKSSAIKSSPKDVTDFGEKNIYL